MAAEVWTTVGLEMRMRCSVRPITVLSLMAGGGFYESVAAARAGETLLLLPVLRLLLLPVLRRVRGDSVGDSRALGHV